MIRNFNGHAPKIHASAFIHPTAEIIGMVEIKAGASIWPYCVLRGDADKIVIGENTNVQDLSVIHCDPGLPTILGKGIVVGHRCLLHGARISDHVLVGMGSIVMAATIGEFSIIGAGALVLNHAAIPPKSMALGAPAKIIRKVTLQEINEIRQGEKNYLRRAKLHQETSFPVINERARR